MKHGVKIVVAGMVLAESVLLSFDSYGAELAIICNQTFQTNETEITSSLLLDNISELPSAQSSFFQQNIPINMTDIGCYNINNGIFEWAYESISGNASRMINLQGSYYDIAPGLPFSANFQYTVPTNLVVGWENVGAEMVAPAGTVPFLYTVPLTYATTAHGGGNPTVELLNLSGQLPLTNQITRADIENAATNTINGREAWLNWLLWNDVSNATPWECSIVLTNGGFRLSWPSISSRTYTVMRSTNLTNDFTAISPPLPGLPPGNWFESVNMPTNAFYRVKLEK